MTNEYIAKCPYCNFKLVDDINPEKIIKMIINHAKSIHGIVINFQSISKVPQ